MEKTELREQFFAEAKTDPYTQAVMHHVARAWADGYEQALRDHSLSDDLSHSERFERAIEWLTEERRKAQAQAIIALANVGRLVPELWRRD